MKNLHKLSAVSLDCVAAGGEGVQSLSKGKGGTNRGKGGFDLKDRFYHIDD